MEPERHRHQLNPVSSNASCRQANVSTTPCFHPGGLSRADYLRGSVFPFLTWSDPRADFRIGSGQRKKNHSRPVRELVTEIRKKEFCVFAAVPRKPSRMSETNRAKFTKPPLHRAAAHVATERKQ